MAKKVLTIFFGAVLVLWIALTLWHASGARQVEDIERSYQEYYSSHDGAERLPPVRWDFEQEKLVQVPEDEIEQLKGSGGLETTVVRVDDHDFPLAAYGMLLAQLPAALLHGFFALLSLALAAIIARSWRSGEANPPQ